MGSVGTVCDMSNRHVSHGHPMDVVESLYVRMGWLNNYSQQYLGITEYELIAINKLTSSIFETVNC